MALFSALAMLMSNGLRAHYVGRVAHIHWHPHARSLDSTEFADSFRATMEWTSSGDSGDFIGFP